MKTILATLLAGSFTVAIAAAAHAQSAQVPNPANPYPVNAVATDGTPLPSQSSARGFGYASGAAPFNFVGNFAGAGLDAAGAAAGTGVGVADGAVGYGLR